MSLTKPPVTCIMNLWFLLFKNLCHDNVQENFLGGQRAGEWLNQAAS